MSDSSDSYDATDAVARNSRQTPVITAPDRTEAEEHYSPGEVAELFSVNTETVRRWAESGKLNCFTTLGGHRRFLASEVRQLKIAKLDHGFHPDRHPDPLADDAAAE